MHHFRSVLKEAVHIAGGDEDLRDLTEDEVTQLREILEVLQPLSIVAGNIRKHKSPKAQFHD